MSKCIEHNQKGNRSGYGKGTYEGKRMLLHRITYCFTKQVPPEYIEGLVIRHTCDNPRCVNPHHLVLGTQLDNVQDRVERQRGCIPNGVSNPNCKLTPEDVRTIRKIYVPYSKKFSSGALSKLYNVSATQIQAIINKQSWSHI